jgi:hypothetical protein
VTLARDHLGPNVVTWHKGRILRLRMPNALLLDDVLRNYEEKLADFWCSITRSAMTIEMCSGPRPRTSFASI